MGIQCWQKVLQGSGFKPFHILVSGHVEQREQRARAVRARPCGRDASKSGNVADRNIARTKSSVSEKKVSGRCAARRDSATLCRRHPVRGRVQSGAEDGDGRRAVDAKDPSKRGATQQPKSRSS